MAEHVAHMREMKTYITFYSEKMNIKDQSRDTDLDGVIILIWI